MRARLAARRRLALVVAVLAVVALVVGGLVTAYGEWRLRKPRILATRLPHTLWTMFCPTGETIAVLGYVDDHEEHLVLRLLSVTNGHVLWDVALRNDVPISSFSFSPSGQLAAVADSEGVSIFSAVDGSLVRRMNEDLQVFGAAIPWSASGGLLAVNRVEALAFRSIADGALVTSLSYSDHHFCYKGGEWLSFVGGDDLLAAFDAHGLDIFSVHERKIVRRLDTLGSSPAAFSPHGDRFACTLDRPRWRLAVYSLPGGERLATVAAPGLYDLPIALSCDGEFLAWHDADGIRIARVSTGTVLRFIKSQGELAFSPTEDLLAVSSEQGVIELWPFRR